MMWWKTDLHCPDDDDDEALCASCNWCWCPAQVAKLMWEEVEKRIERRYLLTLRAFG